MSTPASTGTGGRAGRPRATQVTASARTSRSTRNFTVHSLRREGHWGSDTSACRVLAPQTLPLIDDAPKCPCPGRLVTGGRVGRILTLVVGAPLYDWDLVIVIGGVDAVDNSRRGRSERRWGCGPGVGAAAMAQRGAVDAAAACTSTSQAGRRLSAARAPSSTAFHRRLWTRADHMSEMGRKWTGQLGIWEGPAVHRVVHSRWTTLWCLRRAG